MGYIKKCKIENGKVITVYSVPDEAEKQRRRFMKAMDKQGAWMPESNFKKIIEAYNEAFDKQFREVIY